MRNYGKFQSLIEDTKARALEFYGVKRFDEEFLTDALHYHIFLYGIEFFDNTDIIKVIKFLNIEKRYEEWKFWSNAISKLNFEMLDEKRSDESFQYWIYSKFDTIMMVVMGLGYVDIVEDIYLKRGCHNFNQFVARLMTFKNVNEREPIRVLNDILKRIKE